MPLSFTSGQANTHPAQVNPSKYSFGNLIEYQLRHSSSHLTGTLWKLPLWSVRGAPGNPVFDSGQCNGFSKLISNTELTAAGSVSSIHRWILTGLPFLSIWEQSPVRIQFSLSDFDHRWESQKMMVEIKSRILSTRVLVLGVAGLTLLPVQLTFIRLNLIIRRPLRPLWSPC